MPGRPNKSLFGSLIIYPVGIMQTVNLFLAGHRFAANRLVSGAVLDGWREF